jgi:hypothetical protein
MEPPYVNRKFRYSHLSISITQSNQLHVITEKEAKFRLAGSNSRDITLDGNSNKEILEKIRGKPTQLIEKLPSRSASNRKIPPQNSKPQTKNQAILSGIKGSTSSGASRFSQSQQAYNPQYSSSPKQNSNCFIATEIYGFDSSETNILREWRDRNLNGYWGKIFVKNYYEISPKIIPILRKRKFLRNIVKKYLDIFVLKIQNKI